jgi:hypothetical protein
MNQCKHNWIPVWPHKKHDYYYQCARCAKLIWTFKEKQS